MRRLFAACLLSLAAVAALPALAQAPGFSFADKAPLTLDIGAVEVESVYAPPMRDPNVDHLMAVTPTDAVRLWAQQRLKATGGSGRARVIIRDASVVEEQLPRTEGVRGWFTKDQSERYVGRVTVEVLVEKPGFNGIANAVVARSTSVPEDVSLAEREKAMQALVREMLRDLDAQLETAIKTNLFQVVVL